MKKSTVLLIAGPTASGKSELALKLAKKHNGVIINTDSMQVYSILRVLTARPDADEVALAPHYLYGEISPSTSYSTGQWLRDVEKLLNQLGSVPIIFVGGTGLYFQALLGGLSQMPTIPDDIRQKWRQLADMGHISDIYRQLQEVDALTAARFAPQDHQRIVRAMEVYEATGKSITWWQNNKTTPLIGEAQKYVLSPPRDLLYQRINTRFDHMIEKGALDEVKALKSCNLAPQLPAMKAIGVPELSLVLDGKMRAEDAIETAKMQTRRYAKRQTTWFKNQLDDSWERLETPHAL